MQFAFLLKICLLVETPFLAMFYRTSESIVQNCECSNCACKYNFWLESIRSYEHNNGVGHGRAVIFTVTWINDTAKNILKM